MKQEDSRQAAERDERGADRDRFAFVTEPIDECADRRLGDERRDAASEMATPMSAGFQCSDAAR